MSYRKTIAALVIASALLLTTGCSMFSNDSNERELLDTAEEYPPVEEPNQLSVEVVPNPNEVNLVAVNGRSLNDDDTHTVSVSITIRSSEYYELTTNTSYSDPEGERWLTTEQLDAVNCVLAAANPGSSVSWTIRPFQTWPTQAGLLIEGDHPNDVPTRSSGATDAIDSATCTVVTGVETTNELVILPPEPPPAPEVPKDEQDYYPDEN